MKGALMSVSDRLLLRKRTLERNSAILFYFKLSCHFCHSNIDYKSLIINLIQRMLKVTAN